MFDHTLTGSFAIPRSVRVAPQAIEALHHRCGVYTRHEVVKRILDGVGWTARADLSEARLLEPSVGDGVFVVEAARRLIRSCVARGIPLRAKTLRPRIKAFEIHPREAWIARRRVIETLRRAGLRPRTARACARSWIVSGDFLLARVPRNHFSHVAGNPPYVRWSKIPLALRKKYERHLPTEMARGDLFIPFLDKAFESLSANGRCGFVCSDRWRYMEFAEGFRKKWLSCLNVISENSIASADAFMENVDSYPSILIVTKRRNPKPAERRGRPRAGETLAELGCEIRVGPALGHTPAYVLEPSEKDVERRLLKPWIDATDISEGRIARRKRRIVVTHKANGELISLARFPRLKKRLSRYRKTLEQRWIVRKGGAKWYRPIDRIRDSDWARPKLLLPEMAKHPRVAIDRSGAVPSHGVYAIFAKNNDVDVLYKRLRGGKLAKALRGIAPKVKGGYVRCYRRFLQLIRI